MKKILQKFIPVKKSFLGVDIGASEIKAVELKRVKDEYQVAKIGKVATPVGAIEDGKITNLEAVSDALEKLIAQQGFRTKEVVIVVNGTNVITRQVPMPKMDKKDIYLALKYEAERYIPIPVEDLIIDYVIIDEEEGEDGPQYNLLLVAVPQQIVYQYYDLLVGVGLTPVAVEIIPIALWRLFSLHKSKEVDVSNAADVMVDIGTSLTNLVVFNRGKLVFTRSIPIGGEQVTESVAQTFMLSLEDAESYKQSGARILVDDPYGEEVYDGNVVQLDLALRSGLAGLITEIQRSIDFFKLNSKNNSKVDSKELVKQIYLMGGTSKINGLAELIEAELSIPTENLSKGFFAKDEIFDFGDYTWEKFDATYVIALGLALREVVK